MKQERILELLQEAAKPTNAWKERFLIQEELNRATFFAEEMEKGVSCSEIPVQGIVMVMNALYMQTCENRPELLPTLFPVFALICGDREDIMPLAKVDWSLVK